MAPNLHDAPVRLGPIHWLILLVTFGVIIFASAGDTPYVYVNGHAYWRGAMVVWVIIAAAVLPGLWISQRR